MNLQYLCLWDRPYFLNRKNSTLSRKNGFIKLVYQKTPLKTKNFCSSKDALKKSKKAYHNLEDIYKR